MKDGRDFLDVFDNVTPTGFGLPLGIMFYKNVTPSGVFFVIWIELCVIKIYPSSCNCASSLFYFMVKK